MFALPHEITEVRVKVYLLGGGSRTLQLKDKTTGVWAVFEPCKKYKITTPALGWGKVQ